VVSWCRSCSPLGLANYRNGGCFLWHHAININFLQTTDMMKDKHQLSSEDRLLPNKVSDEEQNEHKPCDWDYIWGEIK